MKRFKNILFITTSDTNDNASLERAETLAANNQAELTVLDVLKPLHINSGLLDNSLSDEELQATLFAQHQQALEEQLAPLREKSSRVRTRVAIGIPFLTIVQEVLRGGHDLVIKTAENQGLLDRLLGSNDMHLLRKCPCPVWLLKPRLPEQYRRILAAVDVDSFYPPEELRTRHALNCQILEMAISLALSESAELHIAQAWSATGEGTLRGIGRRPESEVAAYVNDLKDQHEQNLAALLRETTEKLGQSALEYLEPQTHSLRGSPDREIPALANRMGCDLVVMGTVARTGISGFFMGNTAETVLNQLDCSVLAIKPPGFVSPVSLEK
jgi:nucleotide-binding universal stress UspA family protein